MKGVRVLRQGDTMKIIGNPNEHIIDYEKGREMFVLDKNGEFETNESMLLDWIRQEKPHLIIEEEKVHCKQCGQEFDNKGLMLAHIRKEHKKE